MVNKVGGLELYKEYPPAGEEAAIEEIEQISVGIFKREYQPDKRPARRDQHAKAHGCVRGEFIVEANLPEEIRFGIFRESRSYPVWIRFSNGSSKPKHDSAPDFRGMAIKLMGVEGEKLLEEERFEKTQDFILINYPIFFVRNAVDLAELFRQLAKGNLIKFFLPGFNPLKWRINEFIIFTKSVRQKVANVLEIQYWSTIPSKLGPRAVKYSAKPCSVNTSERSIPISENYLAQVMAEHLKSQEACFDFLIQFQTDPDKMPIEDAKIRWDEKLSPYQKVATIKIPPQSFDSPQQREFCENLSYTPWHSLPEHMPLGGLNRSRRKVYAIISKLRHQMNEAPRREPTGQEVF